MPAEAGGVCCACGEVVEGWRHRHELHGHVFGAVEIHGHVFCAASQCNDQALEEFRNQRRSICRCGAVPEQTARAGRVGVY